MSERFLTILALVAVAGAAIYLLRDRIPSPNVSPERPFIAANKHRVIPSADGSPRFEVLSRPGAAGPQYFCAAADFARAVLRAEMNDLLVTVSAEAPSETNQGFKSVLFELRPAGESVPEPAGIVIDVTRAGQSRSVAVALQFCR